MVQNIKKWFYKGAIKASGKVINFDKKIITDNKTRNTLDFSKIECRYHRN